MRKVFSCRFKGSRKGAMLSMDLSLAMLAVLFTCCLLLHVSSEGLKRASLQESQYNAVLSAQAIADYLVKEKAARKSGALVYAHEVSSSELCSAGVPAKVSLRSLESGFSLGDWGEGGVACATRVVVISGLGELGVLRVCKG